MEIIKSRAEISEIFAQGERYRTRDIIFVVLRKKEQHGRKGRVAFIAGKKWGNAVWRNRAKRRMRGVCRDIDVSLDGCDVLFVARSGIEKADYWKMVKQSEQALSGLQAKKNE